VVDNYDVHDVLAEEGIDLSCYWWINKNVIFGNVYADLLLRSAVTEEEYEEIEYAV
jgi:hypothetical protein